MDSNESENLYELGLKYTDDYGDKQDYKKAAELFQKAAELGNEYAQYELAKLYYYGHGVEQDYEKAAELFRKSADQGYSDAQYAYSQYKLGKIYYHGDVPIEYHKKSYYDRFCCWVMLGKCFYFGYNGKQDYTEAFKWFRKTVDLIISIKENRETSEIYSVREANKYERYGDVMGCFREAMYFLAECYYYGHGVQQDYAEAFRYFLSLSNEHDELDYGRGWGSMSPEPEKLQKEAMVRTGDLYYYGHGVEQDYAKAAEYYLKARERKTESRYSGLESYGLGLCYYYGHGVKKNTDEAMLCWEKAALHRDFNALWIIKDSVKILEQDKTAYEEWLNAAEQGDAEAQCSIGLCRATGRYTEQNYQDAAEWFRKSAEQGNSWAQLFLGHCYRQYHDIISYITKIIEDAAEAVKWYKKSAEQGNRFAEQAVKQYRYHENRDPDGEYFEISSYFLDY